MQPLFVSGDQGRRKTHVCLFVALLEPRASFVCPRSQPFLSCPCKWSSSWVSCACPLCLRVRFLVLSTCELCYFTRVRACKSPFDSLASARRATPPDQSSGPCSATRLRDASRQRRRHSLLAASPRGSPNREITYFQASSIAKAIKILFSTIKELQKE